MWINCPPVRYISYSVCWEIGRSQKLFEFPLEYLWPIATYRSYDVPNSMGLLESKKLFVTATPYFACWAPSHGGYNTFKLIDNTLKHKSVPLEWQRWKRWNFGNILLTRKCQYWRLIWHDGPGMARPVEKSLLRNANFESTPLWPNLTEYSSRGDWSTLRVWPPFLPRILPSYPTGPDLPRESLHSFSHNPPNRRARF